MTRQWLRRSCSPYIAEVEAIATTLNYPGVYFLNGCYQWGCTAHAREQDGVVNHAVGYFKFNDFILNNLLTHYT